VSGVLNGGCWAGKSRAGVAAGAFRREEIVRLRTYWDAGLRADARRRQLRQIMSLVSVMLIMIMLMRIMFWNFLLLGWVRLRQVCSQYQKGNISFQ